MSFFNTHQPFVIAGPCSAETREQVLETAAALQHMPVQLFRAGVWKPRTKPGSFEGNGAEALKWLQDVKLQYGLRTTVEVAEPGHVELALHHDVDALWIGARTTVNPFQVQHIADALKGVDIPILIKNPVNPDVDLWEGAIERIQQAGITDIAAIHRGFTGYSAASPYRNAPNWGIPIELRRRKPGIPVICDPSHITGKRSMVADVAQKAMDMGFEGLMIETHPRPDEAWSDAAQQVTPAVLKEILEQLIVRQQHTADMDKGLELEHLRQLADTLDGEMIELLARRMDLSVHMGILKKECNMTTYQPERWRQIVETRGILADKLNLSKEFILALYEIIHNESIRRQLEIVDVNKTEVKN